MSDTGRITVVTGANRGLGFETCRQLVARDMYVIVTARSEAAASEAAHRLDADHVQLDVTDRASVQAAGKAIQMKYGHVDVLVNNAGILMEGFDEAVARRTIEVNLLGAMRVTDTFRPLLSGDASIVMVSSGLGELSCLAPPRRKQFEDSGITRERLLQLMKEFVGDVREGIWKTRGWPKSAYSVSKVGLNAFTRILARDLEDTGIRVNSVCPGWVRTDMGGPNASRDIETGGRSIVWAATPGDPGPSGGFFRDGRTIPW